MPSWEHDIEFMDRRELERLQLERLRETVARAQGAPHYARVFKEMNVSARDITGLEDLRRLPLTSKDDLRAGRPEDFMACPPQHVVRMHASSGTTGRPTAVYHTRSDIDGWADLVARCLCMAGLSDNDVFQNIVGYGLFTGGLGLHYGAERLGAMVIPSGVGNSRRQLNLMKQFGTTAIHVIPSYALKLIDFMSEQGLDPQKDLKLKQAILGAEPHSNATRKRIEDNLGIKAVNCYGLSEMNGPGVAFECTHQAGLHLWEDHYLLEIIDPVTFEPLPAGQMGEVVLTTLRREAMPLIRYRTRDLAAVLPEPCPCGRTHRTLSRIRGRTDDMLILKGVNIFPVQVERVLMAQSGFGGNYLIILDKKGPVDTMVVRAEMSEELACRDMAEISGTQREIARLLKDEILISPDVELVPPGALPVSEGKAIRVEDHRPRETE